MIQTSLNICAKATLHFIKFGVVLWLFFPVFSIRAQTISQAEYFFDADPGVGNGTPIIIAVPADPINFTSTISTAGLPGGLHYLYVRTRTSAGRWSLYEGQEFYVRASIVKAEYFFDADPGVGSGTPIIIGAFSDTVNFNTTLATTGLPVGEHKVFVRTKDEKGFWSLYDMREFYIINPLVKAEYFFDTDPGIGNGTPITIGAPAAPVNFNATIITTGLPPGEHKVFIRTQDEKNFWSLYDMREFYVKPSLIAAEFFIDTDPGLGNGTPLVITPTIDSISFSSVVTTPVLPIGLHFLFVRTMDTFGKWSLYEPDTFQVGSPLPVELISFGAVKIADGKVRTSWQTANEKNNDYFTVEKSANADSFIPFVTLDGAGNSNGILNYEAVDPAPFNHISYYRLKQTDFNGQFTYSKVVAVKFISEDLYFILYPNPNNGSFDISCDWTKASVANVKIMDNMGQLAYENAFGVSPGQNRWRITAQALRKGLYLVQLQIGDKYGRYKFLIE